MHLKNLFSAVIGAGACLAVAGCDGSDEKTCRLTGDGDIEIVDSQGIVVGHPSREDVSVDVEKRVCVVPGDNVLKLQL